MANELQVDGRWIGDRYPTYFIADIAANHNGDLGKAKHLIELAKQAGADCAKFQHFRSAKIVSQYGFESLKGQKSHQSGWKKPVHHVYEKASLPWEWTCKLAEYAQKVGITFFSAPYDLEAVDMLYPFVPAYKIGSGDITWHEIIKKIAAQGKPVFLATGASSLGDVQDAVRAILDINRDLVLMQCNTNYTGNIENFRCVSLNVITSYRVLFPDLIIGLSDHTPGHAAVLGAVALGARVIEKHFTDNRNQEGPDHAFSMDFQDWQEMVKRTRELESALGRYEKIVEGNEEETVIIQRRCLRASRNLPAGSVVTHEDIDVLRPATPGAFLPNEMQTVIGRRLIKSMNFGEEFTWSCISENSKVVMA